MELDFEAAVQVRDAVLHLKDSGHVRPLSWLRWEYYSPPASLRLYYAHAPWEYYSPPASLRLYYVHAPAFIAGYTALMGGGATIYFRTSTATRPDIYPFPDIRRFQDIHRQCN